MDFRYVGCCSIPIKIFYYREFIVNKLYRETALYLRFYIAAGLIEIIIIITLFNLSATYHCLNIIAFNYHVHLDLFALFDLFGVFHCVLCTVHLALVPAF